LYFLALSSGFAILGQYCITFGYRYVTAVEGGIISSSRILLAATMGPFIAADPMLDSRGWAGAGLIFLVNAALAWRKSNPGHPSGRNGSHTLWLRGKTTPIYPLRLPLRSSSVNLQTRIKYARREILTKARMRRMQ
jgi:hypothetical protein